MSGVGPLRTAGPLVPALSPFHSNFVTQQGEPGAAGEQGPAGPKVRARLTQSQSTASHLPGVTEGRACPWDLEGERGGEHAGP